jgi:hypothetical protein
MPAAVALLPCIGQAAPFATDAPCVPHASLEEAPLAVLAVVALVPVDFMLQPIAAATAGFFSHAARMAGVHCALIAALQPVMEPEAEPVAEPFAAVLIDMTWAEQPPSAGTVGVPVLAVLLAAATVADVAGVVEAADVVLSQHASAAEAGPSVQTSSARVSGRSDFMWTNLPEGDDAAEPARKGRPREHTAIIGGPRKSVSPAIVAGVRHVQKRHAQSGLSVPPQRHRVHCETPAAAKSTRVER